MENVKTVVITGGTGLVGRHLIPELKQRGWKIRLLSRRANNTEGNDAVFRWDPLNGYIDPAALRGVSHVVHLAGEPISGGRWTKQRKDLILRSRVEGAKLLLQAFSEANSRPDVFVSASGTGWYGMVTDEKLHTEDEPAAADFLGQTCRQWEAAADAFLSTGSRVVKLRTGIVLAADGGALPVMALPVKLFAGCLLGSGKQQMPWIHIDDLCRMYAEALENKTWNGAYNAVATEHCTHREFMQAIAKALHRPLWPIRIPGWLLKILLGEMAGLITAGSSISNKKIKNQSGLQLKSDLNQAVKEILFR